MSGPTPSALNLAQRATALRAAQTGVDLLVVGGGINGAGIALDAAARGLRVLLVEREDLASGTSSRSSKMIHGGLRYLQHLRFGLVREALSERELLVRLAPHLVKPTRFLLPLYGPWWETPYMGTGLSLYRLLAGGSGGFELISAETARSRVPVLRPDGLRGAFEYGDAVTDDARLVVGVARTAASYGAGIVTRAEVVDWLRHSGRIAGAVVADRLAGTRIEVEARLVVDATGAFEAEQSLLATGGSVTPSRGTHIVVARGRIDSAQGLTLRVPPRLVFLVPWNDFWIIGTTDVPHRGSVDHPAATYGEVEYLLETVNQTLDCALDRDDIVGTYAGIRPLAGTDEDTSSASREEEIEERQPGLLSLRGGKFTTYRRVAEKVVDRAVDDLSFKIKCTTGEIPIVGAASLEELGRVGADLADKGIDQALVEHLIDRYGLEAAELGGVVSGAGGGSPLLPGFQYTSAEVRWAVEVEGALSIDDVLARRLRVSWEDREHGAAAAGRVAAILAPVLGWEADEQSAAVSAYIERAAIEYGSGLAQAAPAA